MEDYTSQIAACENVANTKNALDQARESFDTAVLDARQTGASYAVIGNAAGMTRQAIQQMIRRLERQAA